MNLPCALVALLFTLLLIPGLFPHIHAQGPVIVTFHVNPPGGYIIFNGTHYTDGQTTEWNYVPVTRQAFALEPSLDKFTSWTVYGGVKVANFTSNPTNVTINGSGTLTANFTPVTGTSLSPTTLFLSALSISTSLLILKRKRL